MNTKFNIGQRVTYPVTVRYEAKIDAIQIGKDGNPRYSVGGRMVLEPELKEVGVVFEKPAPTLDKPEPVNLYCVKDFINSLSRGKIYETDENGHITYDHGGKSMCAVSDPGFRSMYELIVPLVKRPAKIGEYIIVAQMNEPAKYDRRYDMHDILKVTQDDSNIIEQWKRKAVSFKNVTHPDRSWEMCVIENDNYLVLDGYHGDPA